MTIPHGDLLYEGKAKRIYAGSRDQQVLVEFKNDATAFNAQKKAQLDDKESGKDEEEMGYRTLFCVWPLAVHVYSLGGKTLVSCMR